MSVRLIGDDVVFTQRFLKREGYYIGRIDGLWGRLTERAYRNFDGDSDRVMRKIGRFDHRSERSIRSLALPAQELARHTMMILSKNFMNVRVLSGTRSYHEQNQLYRMGRYGDSRPRVTRARGGQSRHNFGIAWDIGLFTAQGSYIRTNPHYEAAGAILMGELPGPVEWGGRWTRFKDRPHYQLKTGYSVGELRAHFESGGDLPQVA